MATAKDWITALRLKTLPASVMPVALGSAYAHKQGIFNLNVSLVIFFCAIMIQLITNFFNEIYDFKKGADTDERLGPTRGVSAGTISLKEMWIVTIISLIITFFAGLYLVDYSNMNILYVGIISLVLSWAYTGGPYPLAYKGLGDIFVLIFFGIIATCGTYYVFSQGFDQTLLIASLVPGFLSMNILSANNIRDIETDVKVGKITMAVRMGDKASRIAYIIVLLLTFLDQFYIYNYYGEMKYLLPILSAPISLILIKLILTSKGKQMNKVLGISGLNLMLFGGLQVVSFII